MKPYRSSTRSLAIFSQSSLFGQGLWEVSGVKLSLHDRIRPCLERISAVCEKCYKWLSSTLQWSKGEAYQYTLFELSCHNMPEVKSLAVLPLPRLFRTISFSSKASHMGR